MRRKAVVLLNIVSLAMFMCLVGNAKALYIETFTGSNGDWLAPTVNDSGGSTFPSASYVATGGNPNGHIEGTVSTAADRLYVFQPNYTPNPYSTYGNLTGLFLTTDFKKVSGSVTGPTGAKVRFYIGNYSGSIYNYFVTTNSYAWDPNTNTTWTTHVVPMTASAGLSWPNQNAGTITFAQMLTSYNDIGLVFADGFSNNQTLGFSGTAILGVDNFGSVVPLPGELLLLGAGLFRLTVYGRRKVSS